MEKLIIKGARQHNLKNISLEIPKHALVVFTGVSGSGKSSLAFDTIYAEGQRRYVESLSSYARQFLGIMDKPDVDAILGLSPAISIDQKSTSHNPRSTVGTVTEIYDYLRLLFARIGHPHCTNCGREISRQTSEQIVTNIIGAANEHAGNLGKKIVQLLILAPIVRDRKGEFSGLFDNVRTKGYRDLRVDGHFFSVEEDIVLIKTNKHAIDVVIDRLSLDSTTVKMLRKSDESSREVTQTLRTRLTEAVEQALALSDGLTILGMVDDATFTMPDKPKKMTERVYSERFACPVCNISIAEVEPRSFSFNSPHGACPACTGLGMILTVDPARVIAPELTLNEGGVIPFAKMFYHDTWYSRIVATVAKAKGIDPTKPLKSLTPEQLAILLDGTGQERYLVEGTNRFGEVTSIEEPFYGIVSELKRRYSQSQSDYVKWEIEKYMKDEVCAVCDGKRLKKESLTVTILDRSIADVVGDNITRVYEWMGGIVKDATLLMTVPEQTIATPILKEIMTRLTFLRDVGLEYLTLSRSATTLSGGEAQRIRLASQIGSGLSGVLYVLDEPSIGLHQRDNQKLIDTLFHLRDLGNTVIVVEHDRDTMEAADFLVDFGPGAGKHGGTIIAQGTVSEVLSKSKSLTAQYLSGKRIIRRPERSPVSPFGQGVSDDRPDVVLVGAAQHNLKNITVRFPQGKFICVTGVSGSGKSTLIVDTLYEALFSHFNPLSKSNPGKHKAIEGVDSIDKVILIDQSPIGRTPRSNPATYTGIFTYIRDLMSHMPAARLRGFTPGRFSFNVKGGRCEACEGEGQKKIEMQFLSDVYVTCEVCRGTRYNAETLEVSYHGKNIAEILDMTVEDAAQFFTTIPHLSEKLTTIRDVGLGYIHLGQPATTLSGGEAQRVKLATELSRRSTGKTVYILDEPTTGLHFADLENLLGVLHKLTELGNTVIVIEHNLDIIKNADWIIDLGPEGGQRGGDVMAQGPPIAITRAKESYTGQFLKKVYKQ